MKIPVIGQISDVITIIGDVIDDLHTSDEERIEAGLKKLEGVQNLLRGQQDINKIEAAHPSIVVAGWRPYIGWVCGTGIAYQFVLYPILVWGWVMLGNEAGSAPPPLEIGTLMTLVLSMLGVTASRSYDKKQGTDTRGVTIKKR